MCGITGIYNFDNSIFESMNLEKMTNALCHRGPDGSGTYINGSIGLGHRRLSILDLTDAGYQPMSYAGGRYQIVYNGEVYNFLEIRQELEKEGFSFASSTDTEVLLAAYIKWGEECLLRFNGMWAFAIYDKDKKSLFLSRDRFGIKPLYYALQGRTFLFGSEMKAILAYPEFSADVDFEAFSEEIRYPLSLEGGERTLFKKIKRLEPGCSLIVTPSKIKKIRWWKTSEHLREVPFILKKQTEEFRSIFLDAVRLRMRSDVPIGTCLSGGLDSSSVVCSMYKIFSEPGWGLERIPKDWQKVFIHTFPGTPIDERSYAEEVIKFSKIKPVFIETRPEEYLETMADVIYKSEDIYSGMLTPAYVIYRTIREHGVKVTLDGSGADEMMGGYPTYVGYALADALKKLDVKRYVTLLHMQREMMLGSQNSITRSILGSVIQSNPLLVKTYQKFVAKNDLFKRKEAELKEYSPFEERLKNSLYNDFHNNVLPAILRNFDRMSMAHGVEVRMPFMDWRLVTYIFSLPAESLINRGHTKLIFREAMEEILPERIRWRKGKIGFNAPMVNLFTGPLKTWAREILTSPSFLDVPYWNGKKVMEDYERMLKRGMRWPDAIRIWPYLHGYLWLRQFTGYKGGNTIK